jgi:plastocyanin
VRKAAALVSFAALLAAIPFAGAATQTVRIEAGGFRPATITIDLDDTVRWRNVTTSRHQVVSETGAFASPVLQRGETYSLTFTAVGRYPYRDAFAPLERGVVVVREPPAAVAVAATPGQVVFGAAVSVGGTVSNRRQGEQVEIIAQPHGGAPASLGVVTTTTGGAFSLTHQPAILTSYSARWRSATSQPATVQVRPRITFRRTTSRKRFVTRIAAGRSYAGRSVYLQRRSRFHQWVNVRKLTLGPRSGRIFDLPRRGGRYRIVMTANQAGAGYLASWSGVQRVRR